MTFIHVVAGVVANDQGEILLGLRPQKTHQGGLWEFPGGKRESGETPFHALQREFHEEIGIEIQTARPLIQIRHDYGDKQVLLDVWRVLDWSGIAHGREGQQIRWCAPKYLTEFSMPAANLPIVQAVQLPDRYLTTPEPFDIEQLQAALQNGIRLVQLRAHSLDDMAYHELAEKVLALCEDYQAWLLLNRDFATVEAVGAHGIHLTAKQLSTMQARPSYRWVAASCHSLAEVERANRLGVDFIVLSPVKQTASHPSAAILGWSIFQRFTAAAACPVYALGGMQEADLDIAWTSGAQGIAAISAWMTTH